MSRHSLYYRPITLVDFSFFLIYHIHMKKICPKCNKISNGEHQFFGVSNLLFGGFNLGVGLNEINDDLFGSKALGVGLSLIFLLLGCFFIINYFVGGKICPNCKNKGIIPINDPKAKELIEDIKLKHADSICANCYYIGLSEPRKKQNLIGSIVLTLLGSLGILLTLESGHQFYDSFGFLVFLGFGIYGLSTNYFTNLKCANCGKLNTIIPLDSPEAQTLIKEHNLSIPDGAPQPSSPKTSQ